MRSFSFCRSFIGEGYGKYLPIGAGVKDQKFDVFHSQREGFSRTG